MVIQYLPTGYYLQRSFFAVMPYSKSERFNFYHFEILMCLAFTPSVTVYGVYKRLQADWRLQYVGMLIKRLDYLHSCGYVNHDASKRYTLTDKSLLLIARVERKLQAIVKEQGLRDSKPVGRPRKDQPL